MKKIYGFSSFEFYFVMAVIGLVVAIGLQRYYQLAEQTQRFSFEILSQHYATAVNNIHTRWIIQKNQLNLSSLTRINIDELAFNRQGWPVGNKSDISLDELSVKGCYQLWLTLLQNPPAISFSGGEAYGSRPYHLSLSYEKRCRYELLTNKKNAYYFEYSALDGRIVLHTPSLN